MVSNFKKNKRRSADKHGWRVLGGMLIVGIVIFLVIANINIYHKKKEFTAQVVVLQKQIKEIENRNNNLKEGIENNDNQQYIEKVAREELNLQKPGEQAVSFVMPKTDEGKSNQSKSSFFQFIINWFGKN